MANLIDPMDIKQIIVLHKRKVSQRSIATQLSISRKSIGKYIKLIESCDYSLDALLEFSSEKLRELFPSKTTIDNDRYGALMSFFEDIDQEIEKTGFTSQFHYREYCERNQTPYSYTQFQEHFNRKFKKIRDSMKLDHTPGREMFVDYAGKKLEIIDKDTGEVKELDVFVAILPSSMYTYVEACESQKREDFIRCCANALQFYGGVPQAIVTDNLKAAVTKACKNEPVVNRSFKEFAVHYGTVINPTRSYSPQDKALVENAVSLSYQRIYHPMRNMTFFSLDDINAEIKKYLEAYNDMMFQRKDGSRKELFQSIEKDKLSPLPIEPYELKEYKRARVQKIGYVYFSPDKTYYSVPYRYIGKDTTIHYTKNIVEVYLYGDRIAIHNRKSIKGTYITEPDHLSSKHQAYTEWSPEYFIKKGREHGKHVELIITKIVNTGVYPEVQYKRAMGIIQLYKDYGSERLNNACELALYIDTTSYHRIKNILHHNLDATVKTEDLSQTSHIPQHENIRGSKYYH